MKKLIKYSIVILTVFSITSCIGGKKTNDPSHQKITLQSEFDSLRIQRNDEQSKMKQALDKIECKEESSCLNSYKCFKQIFQFNDYYYNEKLNKLISCSVSLAQQGEIEIEKDLIQYFNNVYNFLKLSIENNGISNQLFEHWQKDLRSPEAFKVAMKYAQHGQWDDCCDDVIPSHSGNMFIRFGIGSMISRINGKSFYDFFYYYSVIHDYKLEITTKEGAEKIHQILLEELNKAWKSGKIVLKKYGEK